MHRIRKGTSKDVLTIHRLIKSLATFEKLLPEVTCTVAGLRKTLFSTRPIASALILEVKENGKFVPVAFALYFYNFSTFLGKPGIYLEDLFVLPEYRSQGYGLKLLQKLSQLALKENCGRLEWAVLNWNKRAIKFYKKQGAKAMSDWTVFRLQGQALKKMARL